MHRLIISLIEDVRPRVYIEVIENNQEHDTKSRIVPSGNTVKTFNVQMCNT